MIILLSMKTSAACGCINDIIILYTDDDYKLCAFEIIYTKKAATAYAQEYIYNYLQDKL